MRRLLAAGLTLTISHVLFGVQTTIVRLNAVRICNEFSGADAGQKIAACIADLPSTGGTADATSIEGTQSITSDPFSGVTKSVMLKLGGATFTQSVGVTVPTNVTIGFVEGSIISPSSGVTLRINGSVQAPLTQIFAGAGSVRFGATASSPQVASSQAGLYIYPQWWGALGDGSADDTAEIQAAIDSLPLATNETPDETNIFVVEGGGIFLSAGRYMISAPLQVSSKVCLVGTGWNSVINTPNGFSDAAAIINKVDSGTNFTWGGCVQNLRVSNSASATFNWVRAVDNRRKGVIISAGKIYEIHLGLDSVPG